MRASTLYGVGLTAEHLQEIAALVGRGGHPVVCGLPADACARIDGAAVLAADLDQACLSQALDRGAGACIEVGSLDATTAAECVRRAAGCTLFLSLTTASAYRLPVAQAVVAVIDGIASLGQERRDDVELALQEAISNAVIHGNLAVSSLRGPTLAALDAFSCDLNERLADPALANLRVGIAVSIDDAEIAIEVIDEGPGFVPKPRAPTAASGRGIGLIESLAAAWELLDDGRRVRMRFAR
ncbi:ATP-binding protein [Skermanella rosea]|uniref:ATP-binding protein n=1 Tax=Skermanella rosea TaxID=1817965 RepID=UPI001933C839|nr:ATP-binding protein [Skermanella rosea]UEM05039.1 ATP-binding protein [Skermanella rosea]